MSGVVSLASKSFKTKTKVQLFKHQDQVALVVKNLPASARDAGSIPGLGRSTGVVTTPVFLPGESHGQRSLVGYSPWGHKRVRHNRATEHTQSQF